MKKRIGLVLAIGLCIIFALLIYYFLIIDDAERRVLSCREVYSKYVDFGYVEKDEEEKLITISFDDWKGGSETLFSSVKPIYDAIINSFFEESEKYGDYALKIIFAKNGDNMVLGNIVKDSESISFMTNFFVELSYVADTFPNATEVKLIVTEYDDISEIDGFYDLDYLYLGGRISTRDEEYIMSKFPDCVFEQGD